MADNNKTQDRNIKKDKWDKMQSIGGIATAAVVALSGGAVSWLVNNNQEAASRTHLYTELMSKREESENAVRKDMFTKILSSFLGTEAEKKQGDSEPCITEEVDNLLLNLELISRNFHEVLDINPLFRYVLLKIVSETREVPDPGRFNQGEKKQNECVAANYPAFKRYMRGVYRNNPCCKFDKDAFNRCYPDSYLDYRKNYKSDLKCDDSIAVHDEKDWKAFLKKIRQNDMDRLNHIARRIAKKQVESLGGVTRRVRLVFDLERTCQDARPNENEIQDCKKYPAQKTTVPLEIGENIKRTFTISVDRSYPRWNQLYVKLTANKTSEERAEDPNCGSGSEPVDPQIEKCKDGIEEKFWVSYFDFPLVDNTFLSDKERFAVVLDDIEVIKDEANGKKEDEQGSAHVSLLYFPAAYAGLKEKSFYQQRLMNTLLTGDGLLSDISN